MVCVASHSWTIQSNHPNEECKKTIWNFHGCDLFKISWHLLNMDCFQLNHDVIFSFWDREWKQVLVPSNPCRPMISRSHQLYSTKQEHLKKTHAVIVNHVLRMTNPKCFMGNNARIYHMSILQCRFPKSTTGELMKQYRILEQLSSIILILRSVEILFVKWYICFQ